MSFTKRWQGFLALAVGTSVVAGCGMAPASTPSALEARSVLAEQEADKKKAHGTLAFLDTLELTEAQKTQLQTIKDEFKAGIDKTQITALKTQVKEALLAETVDKAKLTTLLTQGLDMKQAHLTRMVDLLDKVREVLTEEQRKALAVAILDKMSAKREKKDKPTDAAAAKDEDKKMRRGMKRHKRAMMAAIGSFMLTGDKAALTQALTLTDKEAKVQKLVDKFAGMTLDERQKLVEKIEKKHERPKGDDDDDVAETPPATPEAETPAATPAAES